MPYTEDEAEFVPWDTMKWAVPRYSRSQVDTAGEFLASPPPSIFEERPPSVFDQVEVVNNWRASHDPPLYAIRRTLQSRAKRIAASAVVAERIKRLPSIVRKLRENRYRHMKLTQVQDIGGCRAIMPTIADALALVRLYERGGIKSELLRATDYIAKPKSDGYRSVHLIYKYQSESILYSAFNNHRIEIQIRSALQHAWATAVETVSTFADVPIRSTSGSMRLRPVEFITLWRRFFALMGSAIAIREDRPIIDGTPSGRSELIEELGNLGQKLSVKRLLLAWSRVLPSLMNKQIADAHWFLMELDPGKMLLQIETFSEDESERAFQAYVSAEQPERDAPSTQVVLVSVDSLATLREAYPNYYADTRAFVEAFETAIK